MNREDFPMINTDYIYLDNGATTWKPKQVIESINNYYTKYTANAHRGDYDISLKVDNEYEGARDIIKEFINAKTRQEIIFTSGTTDSLNIIADGFFKQNLELNDEIIIAESEHASNVLPWFRLAKTNGIIVKFCPLDDNHYVTLNNLKKVITPNTKVISLAAITNVIGDLRPIKEICAYAHQHNIFVVVDGAQSVPHIKTDVQDLDCDFLAFSGHKMCGPTGIGVLYGKYELLNTIEPHNLGGGMNESFDTVNDVFLKPLPTRLEAGTPNIEGAIGLGAAAEYLTSIGFDKISEHERTLRKYLIDKLNEIPHITIYNEESDSGVVSFNVDDIFAQDVAVYLNKYNICVRAGNHCAKILKNEIGVKNTVRISIYLYNTKEEIDKLVSLLEDKNKILNEML
ncbi:MAG TPA: cysteine desulfurase [Firmicutes bacterium]|nr:cysteine desulfurase [Bacillota bacterium]